MEKTLIFGHQKPDTDAVTSAIVLSNLKNKLGGNTEPRVLGEISNETGFVLDYFKVKAPKYLNDVRLQIKDIDYDKGVVLHLTDSVLDAYHLMIKSKISTLPVVDEKGLFVGAFSMKNITSDLIDGDLGSLDTSYDELVKDLNGEEILRFDDSICGNIIVPSYSSSTFKDVVSIDEKSIIIVGDRHSIIDYAIRNKAKVIILTNGVKLNSILLDLAKKNRINVISSSFDGITTSNLVVLSNFIRNKIVRDNIVTVNENDPLYDALDVANDKKFNNYPVLNNSGKCLGIFRSNINNNRHPKKVILVDHNEIEQSASGLDEAEIVEIIDHHKIGNVGTSMPINFRNMPLGCTETILYLMYHENGVEIDKTTAGLMLSGIISDTLLLTSPTTTDTDIKAVKDLAKIAGVDYKKYGMEMFKAGSSIEGKSLSEVIHGDFKNFNIKNVKFGIGQISTMNPEDILSKQSDFIKELNSIASNEDYGGICLFVTDILKNGSYILYNEKSKNIMSGSFDVENIPEAYFFKGMVSRKKQMVPAIMNYMDNN